nr:immunoglobulin light chain junction region [Macaca mulatta]
CQQHETYPLTF